MDVPGGHHGGQIQRYNGRIDIEFDDVFLCARRLIRVCVQSRFYSYRVTCHTRAYTYMDTIAILFVRVYVRVPSHANVYCARVCTQGIIYTYTKNFCSNMDARENGHSICHRCSRRVYIGHRCSAEIRIIVGMHATAWSAQHPTGAAHTAITHPPTHPHMLSHCAPAEDEAF